MDSNKQPVNKETLLKKYPEAFSEGVGELAGEYNIRNDKSVDPVQHTPRRVPVALREKVKEALETLEKQQIIVPVTTPTPWISSMVTVPKSIGKMRICLDPCCPAGKLSTTYD